MASDSKPENYFSLDPPTPVKSRFRTHLARRKSTRRIAEKQEKHSLTQPNSRLMGKDIRLLSTQLS